MSTGAHTPASRSRRQVSKPFNPGSTTSSTIESYAWAPAEARPSSPLAATSAARPSFTRPRRPGTRYVYTGIKDGQPSRDVVFVTHKTRTIDGVPRVAVQDRLWVRGRLHETTTDWYSQDKQGNVWYFGEKTAELDRNGRVTS